MVDGRDRRVGAVTLGLGGDAEDQDGPEERAEPDDQRQQPRGGEGGRRRESPPSPAGVGTW